MSLTLALNQAYQGALKNRQSERVAGLRLLLAALKNQAIAKRAEVSDEEAAALLRSEAKKRREALAIYQKAGRQELADRESGELRLIEEFLPKQLEWQKVTDMVKSMKARGELPESFGEAMKLVMGRLKGQAEGRVVAEAVKAAL